MTIHYAIRQERKKLVAAAANLLCAKSTYAGAPSLAYIVGEYTISRDGTLSGPDNRELVEALAHQGFEPTEEDYDVDTAEREAEPEAETPTEQNRLIIEVPIDEGFTSAKMANLVQLVGSRESLLKKVLGADTLPIEQTESSLKFPWFPVNDNAMVYVQLVCALVHIAMEATRITAREKPVESEKFRMRTFLLRLGFIGETYKQARKVLLRGLSGNSSYAKIKAPQEDTGMNSWAELMADEEMIHAVNKSFEEDGD